MKHCILIAGMPASGKTTFANHLAKQLSLPMVSKDLLKELMYDTIGFSSSTEKITLSIASTQILYYFAESMMRARHSFILENNFENVQKPQLQQLLQKYQYHPITIRFGGDIKVIYKRYLAREGTSGRHPGHSVKNSYPQKPDPTLLRAPLSLDEFAAGVETRGIRNFSVGGDEILVDATHFSQLSYQDICDQVRRLLGRLG